MENALLAYSKAIKLDTLDKRNSLNQLIAEKLNIHCEARIYRILTRLKFQTLRRRHGEKYNLIRDELQIENLLHELGLIPSTCLQWYYSTINRQPLRLKPNACAESPVGNICECCINSTVREKITGNYEYRLASKKLYQGIVKAELFKESLEKTGIAFENDDELSKSLRRLVGVKYGQKSYHLKKIDLALQKVLEEQNKNARTMLRLFYVLRHHPELIKKAQNGTISPDEIFEQPMKVLRNEMQNGGAL